MAKRRFKFDTAQNRVIEVTSDGERAVCDQIEKSVQPYHEPLEFQLPKSDMRRRKVALWPRHSEAMGVHPSQVQEAMAEATRKGVPTEYSKDGRPLLRDKNHEKKFCRAMGYFHRNAGYGDAAPEHYKPEYSKQTLRNAVQKRREEIKQQIREIERSLT